MKSFTKEFQDKINNLKAEEEALNTMVRDYPSNMPEPSLVVWHNSSLSEFGLIFKVKTMEEVKNLVDLWNPYILPLQYYKGNFTGFRTPMHKQERGEPKDIYPVTYKISQFGEEFEFYALVNNHLLNVSLEFEFRTYSGLASLRQEVKRYRGEITERTTFLNASGFKDYKSVKWWSSPEYANSFTLYWSKDTVNKFDDIFAEVKHD